MRTAASLIIVACVCVAFAAAAAPTQLWSISGAGVRPAVSLSGIVFTSVNSQVTGINATTGTTIWNVPDNNNARGYAYDDATDTLVSGGDEVYAYSGTNGQVKWSSASGWFSFNPFIANGMVFVGSDNMGVYGLNLATGAQVWAVQTKGQLGVGSPVADAGFVYFASQDTLFSVNATTGAIVWNTTLPYTSQIFDTTPVVKYGMVFTAAYGVQEIWAFDQVTGTKLWAFGTDADFYATASVASGVLHVGSDSGTFYGLWAATGQELWSFPTASQVISTAADIGDYAYFLNGNGNVYAVHVPTGKQAWKYATGQSTTLIFCGTTLHAGVLYVVTDTAITALNVAPVV